MKRHKNSFYENLDGGVVSFSEASYLYYSQGHGVRMMTSEQAAYYLGYKSTACLKNVPVKPISLFGDGSALRWDRRQLDAWLDRLAVGPSVGMPATDLSPEDELAAWSVAVGF